MWWGPVVPDTGLRDHQIDFTWEQIQIWTVFQRWKRSIDFRHSQFKTEMIAILTVSDLTNLLEMSIIDAGSCFSFDWILYCTSEMENKVIRLLKASGNFCSGCYLVNESGQGGRTLPSQKCLQYLSPPLMERSHLTHEQISYEAELIL